MWRWSVSSLLFLWTSVSSKMCESWKCLCNTLQTFGSEATRLGNVSQSFSNGEYGKLFMFLLEDLVQESTRSSFLTCPKGVDPGCQIQFILLHTRNIILWGKAFGSQFTLHMELHALVLFAVCLHFMQLYNCVSFQLGRSCATVIDSSFII